MALLVVDMQEGAVARDPYQRDLVIGNVSALIEACRAGGVEVVHVQHDGLPGEDEEPGTAGWEIHSAVRPVPGEKVVRKRFNSAFRQTDLLSHLERRGVSDLIIVGLQTEYCVDTTIRVAFEFGFSIVVPEMTNTTFDNGEISAEQIYDLHNRRVFAGRFAEVMTMSEALSAVEAAGPGGGERRGS